MISDEKKEEVRAAADIVEVVSDYVKLKRSGQGFVGLCPYHNEKTPSFNVTPKLGIFKCFGCGESGDVFKFVMDREGIGFTEAIRQLAERYGVFIPDNEETPPDEHTQLREGIYHALKFAGVYFYRNLIENPDAKKALDYLEKRGYSSQAFKKYGLGYSPSGGDDLHQAALNAGIDERYLLEADLIKPSNRGGGYYDTFRGRLMFPIFSPTGKVIAFAGRVLGNEKTAKYINSAQTPVYNKSEVVYGVNFARNEIRKHKEVILVEGYTDVITLMEHGIGNVVASSGTALTPGQVKILHRYGERIIMIYDADSAGQAAMKRGINIALAEGMEVQLLELPQGQDPDSFVKQFGKASFLELKKSDSADFVDFLVMKAEMEGRAENPVQLKKIISEVLEAIASIPDEIQRQVYVQHLHQRMQPYRQGTDRDLFMELGRILNRKSNEDQRYTSRAAHEAASLQSHSHNAAQGEKTSQEKTEAEGSSKRETAGAYTSKKPEYEKELIRLMITYGREMVRYICSITNEKPFEDAELRLFFQDILKRYNEEKEISIPAYASQPAPFPRLVGEVTLKQFAPSERHKEKMGQEYIKDRDPFRTARSSLRTLEIKFYERVVNQLADKLALAHAEEEKKELLGRLTTAKIKLAERMNTHPDKLYDHPDGNTSIPHSDRFVYKMKNERGEE